MKKIDLGQALGILANVGVIAGIVFLGVELQQKYVFTEYTLGRIEEGTIPIEGWRLDFDGEIQIEPGYWPDLREYWEIRKHVDYDRAFVQWMDEHIVNH